MELPDLEQTVANLLGRIEGATVELAPQAFELLVYRTFLQGVVGTMACIAMIIIGTFMWFKKTPEEWSADQIWFHRAGGASLVIAGFGIFAAAQVFVRLISPEAHVVGKLLGL